ncbi:MAG TPA: 3-hydroxyacyl-CoA dehydrogenase/enoyl-CoA hydratase family protein [bacterium]|nr:3-hydroxyacyl-CoA dehydrogenase/enoyl-CoA hydratase family protein [bacterium]
MRVRRAMVIGAGVMGSAIAAHLANAGVPVWLLDLVPRELTDEDRKAGRGPEHPAVRSRLARAGRERALRVVPPAFMAPEFAALVTPGNVEDDLHHAGECDWIIEAVVENLAAKQALLARLEAHWRPGAMVSSNTSGLSINAMLDGRSQAFRQHFLGTHFFNPPRYMRLVELIPSAETQPELLADAADILGRVLGKGIVTAKDTPNFIGNRIGAFTSCLAIRLALEGGYTVEEVDLLTGPLIGRPRTGTFRLSDLVGLDTSYHVRRNVYESLQHDPDREVFNPPAPLRGMVERGWLGAKTGRGYYWRRGGETMVVDLESLEYRPQQAPNLPSVAAVAGIPDIGERLRLLLRGDDRAAWFVWRLVGRTLTYAARVLPEISDDVVNVDRAMRWGYHWELGPFELWDALGPADVAARIAAEGAPVPPVVEDAIRRGDGRFYRETGVPFAVAGESAEGRSAGGDPQFFDTTAGVYRRVPGPLGAPADLARTERELERNSDASLLDLGDGVACVELHGPSNAISLEAMCVLEIALDRLEQGFEALVVGTQARDFCAGVSLTEWLALADEGRWAAIDERARRLQALTRRIRRASRPVVAAPRGRTLAAGTVLCLACPRLQAAAETNMGLVEPEAGLIPAGGGTTEVVRRAQARIPSDVRGDLLPLVQWAFESIARAKVSQSAFEARRLGYVREVDGVTMDAERVIQDAKDAALAMVRLGYRPPLPERIRVGGERVRAALYETLYIMKTGGQITAFDEVVGRRLAHIMAGGAVPEGTPVAEEYLLDLEHEAFLGLLGEAKTRERMRHLLQTGRPLRN